MQDKEAIAAALKDYIARNARTQKEAADRAGISAPHFANLLNGREKIGYSAACRIAAAFPEINPDFLLTGEGVLVPPPGTVHINQHQSVSGGGTGVQTITQSCALEMEVKQLREQLAQAKEREDRLLGIIDTLTQK